MGKREGDLSSQASRGNARKRFLNRANNAAAAKTDVDADKNQSLLPDVHGAKERDSGGTAAKEDAPVENLASSSKAHDGVDGDGNETSQSNFESTSQKIVEDVKVKEPNTQIVVASTSPAITKENESKRKIDIKPKLEESSIEDKDDFIIIDDTPKKPKLDVKAGNSSKSGFGCGDYSLPSDPLAALAQIACDSRQISTVKRETATAPATAPANPSSVKTTRSSSVESPSSSQKDGDQNPVIATAEASLKKDTSASPQSRPSLPYRSFLQSLPNSVDGSKDKTTCLSVSCLIERVVTSSFAKKGNEPEKSTGTSSSGKLSKADSMTTSTTNTTSVTTSISPSQSATSSSTSSFASDSTVPTAPVEVYRDPELLKEDYLRRCGESSLVGSSSSTKELPRPIIDYYRPPLLGPNAGVPSTLPTASPSSVALPTELTAMSKPTTTSATPLDASSAAVLAGAGRVMASNPLGYPASIAATPSQPHIVMNLAESQQRLAEVVLQQQEQQRAVEAALLQQKQNHRIFEAAIIQSHMLQVITSVPHLI